MALKYDWDVVIPALEKAQNILHYAKGDCRNTRAMDFLDDCIDNMNTWIENAKPREEEPVVNSRKSIKSGLKETNSRKYNDFRDDMFNAIQKVFEKYNFQEDKENCAGKDDLMEVIKWMEDHYYFDDDSDEIGSSRKSIKSSVRDDFAKGLQMIMKHEGVEFSNGTLEDNMIDIYDNYVSQFYEDELEEEGGVKVATDWFRNTYPDDEEGIFIHNSRKPIKSDYHNKEIYREAFASLIKDSDAQDFDNGDYGIVHYPGFYRILVDGTYETEFSAETDEEAIQKFKDYFANKKKDINNSRKSIKSSLTIDDDLASAVSDAIPMASPYTQDVVTEWVMGLDLEDFEDLDDLSNYIYQHTDEFADQCFDSDIIRDLVDAGYLDESYDDEIESACGSKGKKKKGKKEIKSSTESEILERGYKGHQVQHDEGAWILDQEKRFWSMSDLMQYVDERYNDDEDEDDWDDEEIESSRKPIKSSYVDCFGEECLLVKPDFIDNHDLYFADYVIDNDVVLYSVYHDDNDTYYAVEGEY